MYKHYNTKRVNERPKNDENDQIQTTKNTDRHDCLPETVLSANVGDTIHSGSHGRRVLGGGAKLKTPTITNKWTTDDFPMSRQIGSGHFGSIFMASYKGKADGIKSPTKNQKVVLKCFVRSQIQSDKTSIALVEREICIQSLLNHPHILPFFGYFEDSTNISLVLEYAPNGDLHGFMDSISSKNRLSEARRVLWQVCQALLYLEQVQVAHRDIKPENILCFEDGKVKLGDFGWACWWANGQQRTTLCGTAEYCPPEMLHEKISYNAKFIDRWMLGVLAIELVHTATPFVCLPEDLGLQNLTLDNSKIHNVIFEKIRSFREVAVDRKYSDPAYCDFVGRLMLVEPEDRLSATEATDHEFFVQLRKKKTLPTFFPSVAQRRQLFENSRGNVK